MKCVKSKHVVGPCNAINFREPKFNRYYSSVLELNVCVNDLFGKHKKIISDMNYGTNGRLK